MTLVDKSKAEYEEQLKITNNLRSEMMDLLHRYQSSCFQLVKKRARYVRLAKKAGLTVPTPTWWERGIGQKDILG